MAYEDKIMESGGFDEREEDDDEDYDLNLEFRNKVMESVNKSKKFLNAFYKVN